jgi:ferritin
MKSLLSSQDKAGLNKAVQHELRISNTYKYFATCLQKQGYFGAQKYFLHESEEELKHWQILADFFNDRNDEADMPSIPAINVEAEGIKDLFEEALSIEMELEEFYQELYKSSKDVTVQQFLLQFLEIQRKSIGEYLDLVATLDRCSNDPAALLIFDASLK